MKQIALVLALVLSMVTCVAGSAYAAGTLGDTGVIYNGVWAASDTMPSAAGRMSIRMKTSNTNADSRYAFITDGNTVAITVDTAYDFNTLGQLADQSCAAGDTVRYTYTIQNLGNATLQFNIDTARCAAWTDSIWGTSKTFYRILYDFNNDTTLNANDTDITSLYMPAGAWRQVFVTVYVPDTANFGETSHLVVNVRDSAPVIGGSNGDMWQSGLPLLTASATERDNQWDTVVTTVKGPSIKTAKTVAERTAGRSRPGDTLVFEITLDNDGNDSAYGMQIIDAIPANTRYVPYSADSGIFIGGFAGAAVPDNAFIADSEIAVALDTELSDVALLFADSGPTAGGQYDTLPIRTIQWTLKGTMGENNGDAAAAAPHFNDGTYDAARVSFWVTIQ